MSPYGDNDLAVLVYPNGLTAVPAAAPASVQPPTQPAACGATATATATAAGAGAAPEAAAGSGVDGSGAAAGAGGKEAEAADEDPQDPLAPGRTPQVRVCTQLLAYLAFNRWRIQLWSSQLLTNTSTAH